MLRVPIYTPGKLQQSFLSKESTPSQAWTWTNICEVKGVTGAATASPQTEQERLGDKMNRKGLSTNQLCHCERKKYID